MRKFISPLVVILLFPSLVHAHESTSYDIGFVSGLSHPVLGFDHLLAMIAVGILSAQMGGKAIWKVPLTFILVMLIGGLLGMNGVPLFSVELGIAVSVLALGIALAAEKKLPIMLAMIFVGFFALFHGHAHGSEMPLLAEPALYACGFVAGTAGIHIAGVIIGLITQKFKQGPQLLRYVGASIAGIGFHLIVM